MQKLWFYLRLATIEMPIISRLIDWLIGPVLTVEKRLRIRKMFCSCLRIRKIYLRFSRRGPFFFRSPFSNRQRTLRSRIDRRGTSFSFSSSCGARGTWSRLGYFRFPIPCVGGPSFCRLRRVLVFMPTLRAYTHTRRTGDVIDFSPCSTPLKVPSLCDVHPSMAWLRFSLFTVPFIRGPTVEDRNFAFFASSSSSSSSSLGQLSWLAVKTPAGASCSNKRQETEPRGDM